MKSQYCDISFRYINPCDMSFWCTKCSLSFPVMCWLLVLLDVCSELILWVMSLHSLLSKCKFKESVSSTGDELPLPPVPFEHSLLASTDTTSDEHKAGVAFYMCIACRQPCVFKSLRLTRILKVEDLPIDSDFQWGGPETWQGGPRILTKWRFGFRAWRAWRTMSTFELVLFWLASSQRCASLGDPNWQIEHGKLCKLLVWMGHSTHTNCPTLNTSLKHATHPMINISTSVEWETRIFFAMALSFSTSRDAARISSRR